MCSLPGLPTPGSEIHVLVTRVNLNPNYGLVELWINMNDGKEHIYEQMRKEIQIPKRKFCGLEGKPGEYCLVCINDTWHRARIVSIENGSYTVFLIDQAQPYKATNEALAWGHRRYFHLSPETESCILANVLSIEEKWPEKATQFLNSLPGKKFKGLAQHLLLPDRIIVLDIPVVSKNMCEVGVAREISGDEFKCLVLKCLNIPKADTVEACSITQKQNLNVRNQLQNYNQYFYPELLTNTFESVKVTEVIDPQNIFCELLIFSKALKILLEQIQQDYEGSSDFGEAQPQTCGAPCASRGADGRWRRSVLRQNIETSDGGAEVMHVDEGRTEVVPVRNIRALHGQFLRMPVVTYLCSLNGVKDDGTGWTEDQTEYLKSLICTWTLVARFDRHNLPQNTYDVTLYAVNAACINDCFLKKTGLFVPTSFMRSDKDRHFVQSNLCLDTLKDETMTRIKTLQDSGDINEVASDNKTDQSLQHSYSIIQSSGRLSTHCPSDLEDGLDVLTVGSSVNVKISCIESLQKFWCQLADSDGRLEVLMQDLQTHYASANPQLLFGSMVIARNPDDGMWYRARITTDHQSPVVQVRFVDYGPTKNIPLHDLCLIDPTFLQLNAQAFQCCLFSPAPTGLPAFMCTDAALEEFQKFVDLATSPNKLKCIIKAVTCDEEGLPLKVVDILTPSDSASKLLALKYADTEALVKDPPQMPSDAYTCSTDNTDLGREEVLITSSDSVKNFYCQLKRNSYLVDKVTENIKQLVSHPLRTDGPVGLNTVCLVKSTDNQWYRGRVTEMSPELKVYCVDYGDTLAVNESDIRLFPPEATVARSVPVLAFPLGLSDIPDDVPEEVNHWFANTAVGMTWTISVVEKKGAEGKLIVELSQGSLNVNVMVRERIANITGQKMTSVLGWSNQQLSTSPKRTRVSNGNHSTQENTNVSQSMGISKLNSSQTSTESPSSDRVCRRDGSETNLQYKSHLSAPEDLKTLDEGRKANSDANPQTSPPSCLERNRNVCVYKKPNLFKDKLEEVYASFIDGPFYFWCQYSNTDVLSNVSRMAQEVGQAQQDLMFPETLVPGSSCLALFSDDNQWYRAQVMNRTDETVHVVFIDYGNESEVNIKDVRALNSGLLEEAPQAFLCSLEGFDKSKGFWDDAVYDYFHSLLVDKQLKVTVFNVEDQSEINLPQYEVQIHSDDVVVHEVMQKYWTPNNEEHVEAKSPHTAQRESKTQVHGAEVNVNMCLYKEPALVKNTVEVYASCIVGPHYFWCQFANTDRLSKISSLAQEVGQAYEHVMIPGILGPGSPCLALFSTDKRWYRALVMNRTDHTAHVVFIDYGNESEVHIKDVKPLPLSLLEEVPQAFLCSLRGFDESKGTWNDEVYDEFYNLLVDKPLLIKVDNMKNKSEIAVPQFEVQIKSEGVLVNKLMKKYWTELDMDHPLAERCGLGLQNPAWNKV